MLDTIVYMVYYYSMSNTQQTKGAKMNDILAKIKREQAEREQIIADLDAQSARLADMTDDERKELEAAIEKDMAAKYDFLGV